MAKRTSLSEEEQQWLRDEIAMQSTLDHRNICQLLTHFETPSKITLVLQLCRGGSLVDTMSEAVEDGVPLTEPTVRVACAQLLSAMGYLASRGIVHRDIKLANGCWVDEEREWLVLTDFGYATSTDEHSTFAGSAHYAAPEVHRAEDPSNTAPISFSASLADVWSAGVCLYAMLATALPFNGPEETEDDRQALREKVYRGEWDAPLLR